MLSRLLPCVCLIEGRRVHDLGPGHAHDVQQEIALGCVFAKIVQAVRLVALKNMRFPMVKIVLSIVRLGAYIFSAEQFLHEPVEGMGPFAGLVAFEKFAKYIAECLVSIK